MPPAAASRACRCVLHAPARVQPRLLSLLLVVIASAAPPAQAALSPLIPYTTLGPGVVNAGGVAALLANYNASYVPYNASYPTVAIGLSLPLVPDSVVQGADDFLAFTVDLTNFRGGVSVLGQQHYLSVTYTTDDNSPKLCAIVYDDLIQSGDFTLLIAPAGDALLQAVSPRLNGSGATLFSGINSSPLDFADDYPNLFSIINTADATFLSAMNQINAAAQFWAALGGRGSAYGITTVCIFTEQETLLLEAAKGVRDWIETENERRAGHDPIVTVVDTAWNMSATMSFLDYAAVLPQCPDGTDVMLLQGASSSGLAVAEALASSRLRPKAVIGLNPLTQIDLLDAAQLLTAAGWLLPQSVDIVPQASLASLGGVFNEFYDVNFANLYWRLGAGVTAAQSASTFSYASIWNVMSAALTAASNLTAPALREAVLGLNNQTSVGGLLLFSNLSGVNLGPGGPALQISLSGVLAGYNTYAVSYPVDWPWRLPTAGDAVSMTQAVSPLLIALVVTALGTWVAQILVEQAIFTRRQGSRLWWAWLAAVAGSLGGASVWCSMVIQSSAVTTTLPGEPDPQPIRWSVRVMLLALLPALLLTSCGLLLHMSAIPIEDDDAGRSQLSSAAHGLRLKRREQMKQAALSHRQHLFHLLRAVTWRSVLGGLFIVAAVVLTRGALWHVWMQDADNAPLPSSWVVSFVVDALLIPASTHTLFHALRWRIPAVFLFSAAVMNDWQLNVCSLHFTYAPGGSSSVIPGYPSLSSAVVLIVAGLIAAFMCFVFIGLQFSAMKLSRNDLTVLVISLSALVSRLRARVTEDSRLLAQQRRAANVLASALNAVTLISALPQEYAVPLFLHSGVSQLPTGSWAVERKSITVAGAQPTAARAVDAADESQAVAEPNTELRKLRARGSSVAPEPTSCEQDADKGASLRSSLVSRVSSSSQMPSAADTRFTEAVQASLELQANHPQRRLPALRRVNSSGVRTAAQAAEDTAFLLTAPLVAGSAAQADKTVAVPPLPSLEDVMDHPVAVELFKQELQKTQSVESLVFCLHARCYRALSSPTARKLLALRIADAFIRPQSECEINISTRQRAAILAVLDVRGESGCTSTLLDEAERECLMLIRTNAWKAFTATSSYRLCAWLCQQINVSDAVRELTAERSSQPADLPSGDLSWLSQSGAGAQDSA